VPVATPSFTWSVLRSRDLLVLGFRFFNLAPAGGEAGAPLEQVTVEQRVAGVADEVLGWQPVTVPVTADTDVTSGEVLWHGHVALPPRQPGQYRIVVSEYELLLADPPLSLRLPDSEPEPGTAPPAQARATTPPSPAVAPGPQPEKRLVYADTLVV